MANYYDPASGYYPGPSADPQAEETFRQKLAALSVAPDQQGLLKEQMGLGTQEMMGTPDAKGTQINGHLYVAASPLEHLANALWRIQGVRERQKGKSGLEQSFDQTKSTRGEAMRRWALANGFNQDEGPGPFTGDVPEMIP